MSEQRGARPAGVVAAAGFFLIYGIAVVVNAATTQGWTGWIEAGSVPRAVLRLAGAGLVAWGLLRGVAWAWWVGLALAILWLASGMVPLVVMERGDLQWLQPSSDQVYLVISLLSLV
ncbi:MAG TPA: hypothetical protein VFN71_05650, partial [Methylomirabilota bacterium]|nr:hypothetical protein [Methylomirabilota bacterium]